MATSRRANALDELVPVLAEKVRRYRNRRIGEQNTKASLIEPLLEALGWDIRDLDEVHREFKANRKDKPVDYALKLLRKPRLFIEAKGLGEVLADRKWVSQVLSYATVAGVEWCVLTDGNEYRFFNATAAVDADEKLFCRVVLADDSPQTVAQALNLISRDNLEENLLDVFWTAHFVDRRVKSSIEEMLDTAHRGLIRLIRKRVPELSPRSISDSLARLDIRIDSPAGIENIGVKRPKATRADTGAGRPARARRKQKGRTDFNVTLQDVIAAGLLKPPLQLFRRYRGNDLTAQLLPDGRVEFAGTVYASGSTAAEYARGSITGRRMSTNGWTFWQYQAESGRPVELAEARKQLLESRA